MKTCVTATLVAALVVALMLGSVTALVQADVAISREPRPLLRALGLGGELVGGIVWLLGTTYIGTRLAAVIFEKKPAPRA